MRVLQVISSVNPSGGGTIEGLKQIGLVLLHQGHMVEVACLDAPNSSWLKKFPLKIHALGPGRTGYRYSRHFVPWLRQNAAKYDVVIVNGIWQYSSFGVWLALNSLRLIGSNTPPYFVFTHGMLDPWFKHTYPLKHLKKWLYWPWAEYRVLRDAGAVLFTCESEKINARGSFWLYKCNEIVVNFGTAAPTGNPAAQRQTFLNQFPELRHKRLLLFLSRIHVKKGCDLLIKAFAKVASSDEELHLVMAGPDQTGWQAELHKLAKKLGIEQKITWTGMLLGDLKWGAFYAAEVLVLPSHQENFGIVIAEAMACGVPVLISNKVNIWREIAADGAGLVANDDLDGTIQLLQKWLAMSPDEQQTMQQKAQKCFMERFEVNKATKTLIDTLDAHRVQSGYESADDLYQSHPESPPRVLDAEPFADLRRYDQSWFDRGRPGWYILLWWFVQAIAFPLTPHPLNGLRCSLLRFFGARIGIGVLIRPTARFTYPWKVEIGDYSWIGDDVVLYSLDRISIGQHCVISQNSYLCTGSHDLQDPAFGLKTARITIGNGVWIAADCFIGLGVQIGANAVIGARSSVFTNIPAEQVSWGAPCRPRYPRQKN